MGKWAQYKRRGSASSGSSKGTGPPPAPTIDYTEHEFYQRKTGLADVGGLCKTYASTDGGLTWTHYDTMPWDFIVDWGDGTDYYGLKVRCTEVGNGTTYVGESPPSNVLDF